MAHGVAHPGHRPQVMLYAVNQFFSPNPGETDEWRLPWDRFGGSFWALGKG